MKLFSYKIRAIAAVYFGLFLCTSIWSGEYFRAQLISEFNFGLEVSKKIPFIELDSINFFTPKKSTSLYAQKVSDQYYTYLHGSADDTYDFAKQRGIYFTANSVSRADFLEESLNALQLAGGNAFVLDVKGTNIYFDAYNATIATEMGRVKPLYDLPEIVATAHQRGLYVIARYIAVKDPTLAEAFPDTQVYNPETGKSIGSIWVDPANPMTLAYNAEILREVAASGIDEINLDYIRFGTEVPNYIVGFTGKEKADRLLTFLQMARSIVDTYGNNTKLGISTYAILGWNFDINFESVGQDISRFAEYVDVISPMAYPSTFAANAYYNSAIHPVGRNYYLVWQTLQGYKKLLQPKDVSKLRPWIQGYSLLPQGIAHEIQAVYDSGLCGYTVWNAANTYSRTFTAMKAVEPPFQCR